MMYLAALSRSCKRLLAAAQDFVFSLPPRR